MVPPIRRRWILALVLLGTVTLCAWWWRSTHLSISVAQEVALAGTHGVVQSRASVEEAPSTGAPTASDQRCVRDVLDGYKVLYERLGYRDDPDAALVRAMLVPFLGIAGSPLTQEPLHKKRELLAAAAARYPGNADIAWQRAKSCAYVDGCQRAEAIDRLLALEPDNLAGWLLALAEAKSAANEAAIDATLEAAAKAKHYDTRTAASSLRLQEALQQPPLPPSCLSPEAQETWRGPEVSQRPRTSFDMATLMANNILGTEIPAYGPLLDACTARTGRPLRPERLAACRAVAATVASGDDLIDRMIGERLMVSLTREASDGAQWRERYRQTLWMMEPRGDVLPGLDGVRRRWEVGEVRALEQALATKGLWPAPTGWLPANESSRDRVMNEGSAIRE